MKPYYRTIYLILALYLTTLLTAQATDPVLMKGGAWAFIQNQNQWPEVVRYRAELPGGFLFLRQNQLQYTFYDVEAVGHGHAHPEEAGHEHKREEEGIAAHSFLVDFVGANAKPKLTTHQKSPTYYNYFLGNNPARWASEVSAFAEVRYEELYPGTDMHLTLNTEEHRFKYEFHLEAGARPEAIRMQYRHAEKLWLDKTGNLHVKTSVNEVMEQKPYSYQLIKGEEVEVPSAFVLEGNTLRFELGKYDPAYPLVIDPELIFSTFSGSFSDNWGSTAAADAQGNLYSGGTTFGQDFPLTLGSFDVDFDGVTDMAILKYNATGSGLFYSTLIGGSFHDIPYSMVVDGRNNLVIMGMTDSGNFPITRRSYDPTYNGGISDTPGIYGRPFRNGSDIVLCKLNATGTQLLGSTFFGGSSNDGLMVARNAIVRNYGDEHRGEVVVDDLDNIYVASVTASSDFPFSRPVSLDNYAGVLAKFTSNLTALIWSEPVGGIGQDALYSVRIAPSGEIYACGGTTSPNILTHGNALNPSLSGRIDGFVVRYSPGGQFLGGTYLGTRRIDQAYLLDIDGENNVYVFGQTEGPYPVSAGVYNNPNSGQFIHSIDPTLSQTRYSTIFGSGKGSPNISPTGFMVNSCGNVFLAGWGGFITPPGSGYFSDLGVRNMPITSDALRSSTDGSDFYLMVLERDAQRLLFGSYFGSQQTIRATDHVDGGTSRFDKETATIYQSVCACNGDDFPTTNNAFSRFNNSPNCNNAAFKLAFDAFNADFLTTDLSGEILTSGCAPLEVKFTNNSQGDNNEYFWDIASDTGTIATSTEFEPIYTFEEPGIYTIELTVTNVLLCQEQTIERRVRVFGSEVTISNDTTICEGESVVLEVDGASSYQWAPAGSLNNPTIAQPTATPQETTTYTVSARDSDGCTYEREVTVTVLPDIEPDFEVQIRGGCGNPRLVEVTNNTEGASSYFWDFGNGETSTEENPDPVVYPNEGTYTITLTASTGDCEGTTAQEIEIIIENEGFFDEIEVNPDPTICFGDSAQLFVNSLGDTYVWTPAESLSDPTISNPVASPAETTRYEVTISIAGEPDCVIDTALTVNVIPEVTADFVYELEGVCFDFPIVRLRNTSTGSTDFSWNFGDGNTATSDSIAPFQYGAAGTYVIELITRNQFCLDTIRQEVVIDESQPDFLQTVRMPEDVIICAGESSTLEITGDANLFNWRPAGSLSDPTSNAPVATPNQTTTYTVTIGRDDAPGCEQDSTVTIRVEAPITPRFEVETPEQCGEPPRILLTNLTEGQADRFVWIIDGDTLLTEQPGDYLFDEAGNYEITLIAENGTGACQNITTEIVPVDDVTPPNVITPNGDGKNDRFVINTSREGWQLAVFDRWGGEVFRSDNYQNDWGGDLKSGAYYYQLTSPEGFSCKGWIHVLVE